MARPKKKELEDIVEERESEIVDDVNYKPDFYIPTGSTLFNLALSDDPFGGYLPGTMANLIGDSSSGKSLLALTSFAMMAQDERFDDYEFVYDDVEAACAFNMEHLFGKKAAKRINRKVVSSTIQDYRRNLFNFMDKDKPFVYVLDSFDALTSEEEMKRTKKDDGGGSYKTEKPKIASEIFRQSVRRMQELNAFSLIISQTRDNIGFGAAFNPKTRSGGRALKFFASAETWASMEKQEKRKDLIIGTNVCMKVTKNKCTGKKRSAYFPIYYDMGVDNVTSCVNYLIDQKRWGKNKNTIDAVDIGFQGTFKKIVEHIEDNNLEREIEQLTGDTWNEVEESVKLKRKKRFE